MEREYQFKIGQKVKSNGLGNGEVVDKTSQSVFIHWDGDMYPIEHPKCDYDMIELRTK